MNDDGTHPTKSARHDRVRALFLAAARLPAQERAAFVERESAGDGGIAADVRALLAHDDPDESFIAKPALAAAEALAAAPKRIGSYAVRSKIGEGGMGSVFECLQENPQRVVAVKVLHVSVATEATRHRFEREARLLARLHHPGIAQIFEAGEADTDFGRQPYLVMERVAGLPITEFASQDALDTPARLELFARVCDAVQHAHDRGVVHRDLKPANVLVDGSGQPKVLDFGIARLLERDEQRLTSALTGEDAILGTVPYLSPEQASGHAREIDGRADVYSLGVLLYELLTGDLPFDVRARPAPEALRIVLDRDPTPPGTRLKELRGDVETILGKAMEKDRARRYASPAAFASDVRRHLRNEPIEARPPSALYRARKFTRRNRALVAGSAATFVALAAGGVVATIFAIDEHAARERADWNAYRSGVLLAASALTDGDVAAARTALDATPEAHRNFEWNHLRRAFDGSIATFDAADRPCVVGVVAFSEDGSHLYVGTYGAGLRVVEVDVRGRASAAIPFGDPSTTVPALDARAQTYVASGADRPTVLRAMRSEGESLSEFGTWPVALTNAAISPLGTRVAGWTDHSTFELFDTSRADGPQVAQWSASGGRSRAVFSDDGTLLAFSSGSGFVWVVDADSGAERARFREAEKTAGLAFTSGGSQLAVGYGPDAASPHGGIAVYDLGSSTLARRFRFDAGPVHAVALAPDGAHLAIGTSFGAVHVIDAASGARTAVHRSHGSTVSALAYSPDGTLLAAGTYDGSVSLFPAALATEEPSILRGHASFVYGCAFSADGKTVASGAWDHTIRVWDAASGTELAVLKGHSEHVKAVSFDPSGERILSVSGDRTCRLWDIPSGREIDRYSADGGADIYDATLSSDGSLLVVSTCAPGRVLFTRSVRTGEIGAAVDGTESYFRAIAASRDGRFVAVGAFDGSVRIFELPSLALARATATTRASTSSIACSSDSALIAAARLDGTVEVFDAATLESRWVTQLSGGETFAVQFSPAGDRVAAGGRDGRLRLIDCQTGDIVASLGGHSDYIYDLDWSRDGSAIVTASGDTSLRIWDTAPAGERLRARIVEERARAAIAPRVRAMYAELGNLDAIAARIESDPALSPDERAAMLREALRQRP